VPRLAALIAALTPFLALVAAVDARADQQAASPSGGAGAGAGVNSSRLFVGPTARMLEPGEGYFVLHGAVAPSFQIGVTDRFSFGAGTFFFGEGVFWVTPKVRIATRGATTVSAGVLHLTAPGEGHLGLAYVGATRDGARGGLSFGAGVAYTTVDDDDFSTGGPLLLVGGDYRLSRRAVFMNETYVVIGVGGMSFNGVRLTWGRFSLDAGAIVTVGGGAIGGPIVNLGWAFGGRPAP
jgi:hypothetical protein